MMGIVSFLKNIKKKKFWDIKDTYLYKADLGNHWHIKKFTVLYKHLLVDKDEINQKTLETISKNFEKFCNSIKDEKIKRNAINYFFKPDIRKKDQFIDFKEFNDEPEYDDNARKFFMLRLLNEGGESRTPIKDRIKKLINNNYKMSKIINSIPKIKLEEIAKAKKKKKKPRSVKDSVDGIISDYPATIRNDRQLFTYWGYMPSEENGYVLNQIGELIYQCDDQILLNAIGDHQRFKMRLGNPGMDNMEINKNFSAKEIINQFNKPDDFGDYDTNPAISIFEVLKELRSFNIVDEYKFIITRIAPFNLDKTIELVNDSRKNYTKIKDIYENLHEQKKTRDFRTTKISKTENVNKQINNLMYGSSTEKTKNENVNHNSFIKIHNRKISITNDILFDNYFRVILFIKKFLNKKYLKLYSKLSNDYKIKLINEVANSVFIKKDLNSKEKNKYINSLNNLKKSIQNDKKSKDEEFNLLIENKWEGYISNIDPELLLICYALNLCLDQFVINKKNREISYDLPSFLVKNNTNVTKTKNIIKEVYKLFLNSNYKLDLSSLNLEYKNTDMISEDQTLLDISPSNIQKTLEKESDEIIFTGKIIEFKRELKIMRKTLIDRNKNIIHGFENKKIDPKKCDICDNEADLDCHHIVPHKFKGPDINLNYVFICKKCHKLFTFKTSSPEKALDGINILKLKNLISFEKFELLIKKRLINRKHLKYLLYFNYIHLGQYLELVKIFCKINKISNDSTDKELVKSKLGISNNRWWRLQAFTFFYRKNYNLIMQKRLSDYPVHMCDGGCRKNIFNEEKECHHIIPKEKKYIRHKNKSLNGSESPFNYAYLCKKCHRHFTDDKKEQFMIIEHFKSSGIVSRENTYRMILDDKLNLDQLDFLKVDRYISEDDYISLKEKIKLRDYYRFN